jgi:hypothetical protein
MLNCSTKSLYLLHFISEHLSLHAIISVKEQGFLIVFHFTSTSGDILLLEFMLARNMVQNYKSASRLQIRSLHLVLKLELVVVTASFTLMYKTGNSLSLGHML